MAKALKFYPAPWEGRLLLACKKCQRKLKKGDDGNPLANLKKAVKKRNKRRPDDLLHVISIPCVDVCPRNAVTICAAGLPEGRISILRTEKDLDGLVL